MSGGRAEGLGGSAGGAWRGGDGYQVSRRRESGEENEEGEGKRREGKEADRSGEKPEGRNRGSGLGVRGGGREAGGRAALGLRPAAGALAEVPVDKWLILVPIGCEGPMRGWSVPPSEGSVLSCHSAWSQH